MNISKPKIVVIDDNLEEFDPLVVELGEVLGIDNVILKRKSSEGLKYILDNLSGKLVVLLDLDLGRNEPNGIEVLSRVREITSLVYVIIMTAKELNNIPSFDLIKLINNDSVSFVRNTENVDTIIGMVTHAIAELDSRIDCAIEEWIIRHEGDKDKPYITSKKGNSLSLNQVLKEVRTRSDLGKELEKGMLDVALYMLTSTEE